MKAIRYRDALDDVGRHRAPGRKCSAELHFQVLRASPARSDDHRGYAGPGVLLYFFEHKKMSTEQVNTLVRCGLWVSRSATVSSHHSAVPMMQIRLTATPTVCANLAGPSLAAERLLLRDFQQADATVCRRVPPLLRLPLQLWSCALSQADASAASRWCTASAAPSSMY